MVIKEKDTNDIAAGADLDAAALDAPATVTAVKKVVAPVTVNGSEEKEEENIEGKEVSGEKKSEGDATSSSDADATAAAATAAAESEAQAKSERLRIFMEEQEQIKQVALVEFNRKEQARTKQALLDQQVERVQQEEASEVELEELTLTAAQQSLLDYHAVVSPQLASPVAEAVAGISLSQLQALLTVASQKYCVALCLNDSDSIHLLHSAFMIGSELYAYTSKGGINGEQYVKFNHSEFCLPMTGLS